jgi:uncharacterized protein (DUF4415 family)
MKKHHRRMTPKELANVKDEDIDFSDIPELDDSFWNNASLIEPDKKKSITLRVKGSVLDYFKAGGKGVSNKDQSSFGKLYSLAKQFKINLIF